ncbi:Rnf-Nqr domain containing protein [Shigella boydii]
MWKNNSALVQLLGLCPLLAVTSTATNALGFRTCDYAGTDADQLDHFDAASLDAAAIRTPIYVVVIASVVSALQMLINAYAFGLYQSLRIFPPLIVTNCIVVGRAEAFAAKKSPALSALDGFSIGIAQPRHVRAGFPTQKYRQWHVV